MKHFIRFFVVVFIVVFVWGRKAAEAQPIQKDSDDQWAIMLLNGVLQPTPGVSESTKEELARQLRQVQADGGDRIHLLVQLNYIPTEVQKEMLADQGIWLQHYIPNYAWIAAVDDLETLLRLPGLRWLDSWSAADKLHPNIHADSWGSWAIHPTEPMVMTIMQLHTDVPLDEGAALAEAYGGVAMPAISGIHGMTVWIAKEDIAALAAEEAVLWIEEGPPPLSPNNDGVRDSMNVNPLYTAPYGLDGSGVRLFVFDGGLVRDTHTTFNPGTGSRVIQFDGTSEHDHPTHVAGTAAGDGNGGRAMGVAPGAAIISAGYQQVAGTMLFWDNAGDIQADYATARNTYNADLGTNSIGSNTAANNFPCSREGDYGVSSNLVDGIVRGDNATVGSEVLMTWANGNERSGGSPRGRCGSNYVTTAPPSCAKNPIHVGAINSNYDSMTTFSSWGPCDDGRLKPIVSASGCELARGSSEGFIYSALNTNDNAFGGMCGTSMATPAVAGVVSLFIEEWRNLGHGGANDRPLPALMKAMLMHTARDLGQDGPDYIYGYGEVDALMLIGLLRAGGTLGKPEGITALENWGDDSISNGQTDTFTVTVPANTAELKVSLAWDDYAAAAFSGVALVNNLDLEVVAPDSTVYYPWALNPAAPYQPATTGINNRDNQEQVSVANPAAGVWTIRVIGTAVPQGPQSYGLVYTTQAPAYNANDCTEQIVNSGFEVDTANWTLSAGPARVAAPAPGHGNFSLRFGNANNTTHTAYQTITIPGEAGRAELSFWWYMTTNEGSSGHGWDFFYAEVRDTSDTILAVFDYRNDGWQAGQWMKSENIDLTPWEGQTVRLYFAATNDGSLTTTFYVDDVSVETCSSAPTAIELQSASAITGRSFRLWPALAAAVLLVISGGLWWWRKMVITGSAAG